jgi:hypothetical protein
VWQERGTALLVHHLPVGSIDQFERFRRVVLDDPELQAGLRSICEWPAFVSAALDSATRCGLSLTADDLDAARAASRQSWFERWL